ncbi:hypothetical protein KA013_03020 [Patescibacteria group bacterium]|nr:hypothetical protein [Patescibacteria group bacterium]
MFDGSRPSEEVQKYILLHQVRMEDHMLMTAESVANILEGYEPYLVCDRGIADQRAHIDYELFEKILKENGFPQGITDVFGRYDAVFHMETSPKEYYKLDNPARSEKTREEGMKRSKQFLDARV